MTMIVAIIGNEGDGKSLLLTVFSLLYKKHDYKILSNMDKLKIRDFDITHIPTIIKERDFVKNKYMFALDEAYQYIDAREAMTKKNRETSYFLFQLRKLGINLFYTAQFYYSVDLRLRRITNIILKPKYDKKSRQMVVEIFNGDEFKVGSFEMIIDERVYNFYDTFEFVNGKDLL